MMDFPVFRCDNYNLMVVPSDLPVFGAVCVDGDRWSLIGPSMGEPCGGVRCVGASASFQKLSEFKAGV
jgi:hypothetical protein